VAVCAAYNVISLIAILRSPETLGIDLNRVDAAAGLAGGTGVAPVGPVTMTREHRHG
jgi:hypothetical protein